MMIVHESERIQLKVFTEEDIEAVKIFWGDANVMEHCGGATPSEILPKVLISYQRCHEKFGLSVYAVVEKQSGQVIGAAGYNVKDSIKNIELIYHFSKASWGKGYATEAAMACIQLAKQNTDVNIIYASADNQNKSSIHILKKIGFDFIEMRWFDDTNQEESYFEYILQEPFNQFEKG